MSTKSNYSYLTGDIAINNKISGTLSSMDEKISGTLSSSANMSGNIMATVLKGLSAYEVAVKNGFVGSEEEWLESLIGNGIDSATINQDYTLTIFYTDGTSYTTPVSLKGKDGHSPYIGQNNNWFIYDDTRDEFIDTGILATFAIGDGLKVDEQTGQITVDSTNTVAENNNKPVTSGGVYSALQGMSYEELSDKPQIENVTLSGNKTFNELGISPISVDDLLEILV